MAKEISKSSADRGGAAKGRAKASADYVNAPANVPVQHAAPGEKLVEDKAEAAAEFAAAAEERLEIAAGKGVLGGPVVWGLLAVIALVILIVALS